MLRLEPREGLLEQCEAWMLANTSIMLPNHIVAYLNVRPPAIEARPRAPLAGLPCSLAGPLGSVMPVLWTEEYLRQPS